MGRDGSADDRLCGIAQVARATGIAATTMQRGLRELASTETLPATRTRKAGGGRKRVTDLDPTLLRDLDALVEPTAHGDPDSPCSASPAPPPVTRSPSLVTGPYSDRFHAQVIALTRVERALAPVVSVIPDFDPTSARAPLSAARSVNSDLKTRDQARKQVRLICETEVLPRLSDISSPAQPSGEPILPSAVMAKAPTYLQRTLLQANGCYMNRWYEASSVMVRKLVENMIIDVYEVHQRNAEIRGGDGECLMLSGLVTAMLKQTHWPLQRETKRSLPEVKRLGDRAAHNRRYEATRQDIDQVLPGLRTTADDLLHLARHK